MKNRYAIITTFLLLTVLFLQNTTYAQKGKINPIQSVVFNEEGNPLANARIFSGGAFVKSDENGKFTLVPESENKIVIEADGYETTVMTQDEVKNMTKVTLKKVSFLYGKNEKVNLAFRQVYEGDAVGFISKLKVDEIDAYDNNIWANDIINGRTLGMLGSNNIRGLGVGVSLADLTGSGLSAGNALYIVDGLPRDISGLRISEIESITILKDVNASVLYGSAALNGVIMITTKRGESYKKKSNFKFNYGIQTPRAMPKFLNSADYMTYYNQARKNDGLTPLYADSTIQQYRTGNKYRYPSVDYYSDEYLKPFKNYYDLTSEFTGGNDIARFYANMGWYSAGSILDFGQAKEARNNIINVRGNVDLKINNWINTSIDGVSLFGNNRRQRGNYWGTALSTRPYEFVPLLPFDLIDPENSLLKGRKNDVDGKYLLGGNANFLTNAIADNYAAGLIETIYRKFSFNNRVDFNLSKVTQGLSFHTNISFDYYNMYDQTIANQYSVYQATWDATQDKITALTQYGLDSRPGTQVVGGTYFTRRMGFYGLLSYDRIFNDLHHWTGSFFGYASSFKEQGDYQGVKQTHLGLQLAYNYNKKYFVDFSSALVNSVKLPEGNRVGFSPTIGLSWIASNEDFLKSAKFVDYLKLRLSGGIINSDFPILGFFYYDNRYATSGTMTWYEGGRSRSGVVSNWLNNPDLDYVKRNEINLGLEGLFLKKLLRLEVNLFYDVYSDQVIRKTAGYPAFYSSYVPYENYNSDRYQGAEAGLTLNKTFGKWTVLFGLNTLYCDSKRIKVDEIYNNDYQYRQGKPVDATFGLEALGLFQDQAEIDASPKQLFGTVKPGDIRYKDQNGDGKVDGNDEVMIRRYQAPWSEGLQFMLSYRDVTFYVLGESRSGVKNFLESNYYWVDGNKKYSEMVLGAWTPETKATATYPRLSSQTNSNNHRRSTYWLYDNDYFAINKIQLSWNMPNSLISSLRMKNISLFANASDVFQFAKNREIRDLNTGGEPYYRTFSVGLKANF